MNPIRGFEEQRELTRTKKRKYLFANVVKEGTKNIAENVVLSWSWTVNRLKNAGLMDTYNFAQK